MSRARHPEPFGPRAAWLHALIPADGSLFDWAGCLRKDVFDPLEHRWYTVADDRLRASPVPLPYTGLRDRARKARAHGGAGAPNGSLPKNVRGEVDAPEVA